MIVFVRRVRRSGSVQIRKIGLVRGSLPRRDVLDRLDSAMCGKRGIVWVGIEDGLEPSVRGGGAILRMSLSATHKAWLECRSDLAEDLGVKRQHA